MIIYEQFGIQMHMEVDKRISQVDESQIVLGGWTFQSLHPYVNKYHAILQIYEFLISFLFLSKCGYFLISASVNCLVLAVGVFYTFHFILLISKFSSNVKIL